MGMRKIHYGWVICVTCTLLLFVTMGTVSNGFSIYLPYIMAERGLTHAQTSSLVTLRCLVAFVAMLLIGGYYRKVSLRVGTGLAVCCAGLAFWLYSAAETYPLFCVGAAVSGISYGLGSMIPVSILINRWFDQHRALALSICASGSGIATIVLPPVTTHLVERFSMSAAFRMEGAAILVCAGVVLLVLRNDPREKGLRPCGQTEIPPEAPATAVSPSQGALETNLDLTGLRQLIYGCGGQSGLFPSIRAVYLGGVCIGHGGADDQRHGGDDYRGQAPLWGDHRPDRRAGVLPAVWRGSAGWASAVLFGLCPEYGTQRGQCPLPGTGLSHRHHGSLCMVQ